VIHPHFTQLLERSVELPFGAQVQLVGDHLPLNLRSFMFSCLHYLQKQYSFLSFPKPFGLCFLYTESADLEFEPVQGLEGEHRVHAFQVLVSLELGECYQLGRRCFAVIAIQDDHPGEQLVLAYFPRSLGFCLSALAVLLLQNSEAELYAFIFHFIDVNG
jgi:hypothetical protein